MNPSAAKALLQQKQEAVVNRKTNKKIITD
jgi:hypothetical protein